MHFPQASMSIENDDEPHHQTFLLQFWFHFPRRELH